MPRQIPRGFRHGKRIAQVSMACEGYFWRLVDTVDGYGNISADLDHLRKETGGAREFTAQQIAIWVSELLGAHLAVLYRIGKRRYLHLDRFERWGVIGNEERVRVVPGMEKAHAVEHDAVTNLFNEPVIEMPKPEAPRRRKARRAKPTKKIVDDLAAPFTSAEFQKAWDDWAQGRKEKGKKVTPTVRRLWYPRLAAMGEARAIEALNYSARQGYTGIYEERGETNGKDGTREAAAQRTARLLRERHGSKRGETPE